MIWRRSGLGLLLVLAAVSLSGCAQKNPHGWISLDVRAAPLPAGWTSYKDASSGLSLDVPPHWFQWVPGVDAKLSGLMDAARHVAPGTTHLEMPAVEYGAQPSLFVVDTSDESLRQAAFTYMSVVHMNDGHRLSIDEGKAALEKTYSSPLERLELPIGPALKQVRDVSSRFSNGSPVSGRVVVYYLMHDADLYAVRFLAPADRFASLQPIIDQIMQTVRIGAPDPSAIVPSAPTRNTNGLGGPGMMPGDAGYGSVRRDDLPPGAPIPGQAPEQPNPQTTQPDNQGSPPDTGTPQGGPDNPGSQPQPGPGSDQPGQDTGSSGQTGSTGGG